jgi:hypothetical protein
MSGEMVEAWIPKPTSQCYTYIACISSGRPKRERFRIFFAGNLVLGAIQLTMHRSGEFTPAQQAALINRSRNPTFGNGQMYNHRFCRG